MEKIVDHIVNYMQQKGTLTKLQRMKKNSARTVRVQLGKQKHYEY